MTIRSQTAHADLYWLPLGAGGHVVKQVGYAYERIRAAKERRTPQALFHSALVVRLPEGRFVIEQVPAAAHPFDRGVVCTGPVGIRWPRRGPFPRYEVHCTLDGVIADQSDAVASPVRVTTNELMCREMLDCLAGLPVPVWGRDELETGEMWNSNSVVAWILARSGATRSSLSPPLHGRAPGWNAGLIVERRGSQAREILRPS